MQLVEGPVVAPFSAEDRTLTIKKIEWYVERFKLASAAGGDYFLLGSITNNLGTQATFTLPFKTEKRAIPSFKGSAPATWATLAGGTSLVPDTVVFESSGLNKLSGRITVTDATGLGQEDQAIFLRRDGVSITFAQADARHLI